MELLVMIMLLGGTVETLGNAVEEKNPKYLILTGLFTLGIYLILTTR